MKFCLIKRDDKDYLCSEFSAGQDANEYTFTCIVASPDDMWSSISDCCGDSGNTRLVIFENTEAAERKIEALRTSYKSKNSSCTYTVVLVADIDTIAEKELLDVEL